MLLQSDIPKRAAPPTPRSRRVPSLDVSDVSIGPVPRRRVPETPSKKENDATQPLHSLLDKKSLQENELTKAQEKQLNYLKVCAINIIERSLAEVDYFARRGDRLERMGRRLATRVLVRFFSQYRKRLLRASLRSWYDQMNLMKQASSLRKLSEMTSSLENMSGSFDSTAHESRRIRTVPSPSPRRTWRKTPLKRLSIPSFKEGGSGIK